MICNTRNKKILASFPHWAESYGDRLLGLVMYRNFEVRMDGMIFPRCRAIHCFFMKMTIDVIFLDRENRVVKLCPAVKPWHLCSGGKKACCTVELPAGTIESSETKIGDTLDCRYFFVEKTNASK